MTHTDMTKPFSSNPKLADWVPSEQQLQTITGARELLDLVPEVTDPQQLVDDTYEFLMQNIAYLSRTQSTGGN